MVRELNHKNQYSSLRKINECAFVSSLWCPIRLHDGIERIGRGAFSDCIFTNFRSHPLITVISGSMLMWCKSMFSLELSVNMIKIGNAALKSCNSLRNMTIPLYVVVGDAIFINERLTLSQIFIYCLVRKHLLLESCNIDLMSYLSTVWSTTSRIIRECYRTVLLQ